MKPIENGPVALTTHDGRTFIGKSIDSAFKLAYEAKPGQRQRSIIMASFEINDEETSWRYPDLESMTPVVYSDRYYPEGVTYLVWQAEQSRKRFVISLMQGRPQARAIAQEVREEIGEELTDGEIIGVVTREMGFKDYAIRIGLKTEDNF